MCFHKERPQSSCRPYSQLGVPWLYTSEPPISAMAGPIEVTQLRNAL